MHKRGQGMTSRTGALVLIVLFGMYAGWSWYGEFYSVEPGAQGGGLLAVGGGAAILAAAVALGAYVGLLHAKTGDFLIDMDLELRKVIWPDVQPVFDPKAEAWGATYVVIVTVVVMAVFIYLADLLLTVSVQQGLLPWLFG